MQLHSSKCCGGPNKWKISNGTKKKLNKMSNTKPWLYAWNNNPLLIKHLNLLLSVPLFKIFLILWYTEHILFINAMSYLKIRYQEKKWLNELQIFLKKNYLRERISWEFFVYPYDCPVNVFVHLFFLSKTDKLTDFEMI